MTDAYAFVKSSNQNAAPIDPRVLERENYLRNKSNLNNPAQIQNILNGTDFQAIKNQQPIVYKNYMNNVMRQDELMKRMQDGHTNMFSKESDLKKKQEELNNLGNLNRYNNNMVQNAYRSQRNAIQSFKNGTTNADDPFLNFMKDPTIFQNNAPGNYNSPQLNQNNALDELQELEQLSRPLVQAHGPASGLDHIMPPEPIADPQENEQQMFNEPFSALAQMDPLSTGLRPRDSLMKSPFMPKKSIISPNLNHLNRNTIHPNQLNQHHPSASNINPPPNQNQPQGPPSYQIPAQSFQYLPHYQAPPPIVNVIPMPYPPQKNSSHSSREKVNKVPEEFKMMLSKQNDLLQNFIEKVERNGTLETKEDYSEKYEQKIRELEKNFDLSQEIMNLKKQLYSFNDKKDEKKSNNCKNYLSF